MAVLRVLRTALAASYFNRAKRLRYFARTAAARPVINDFAAEGGYFFYTLKTCVKRIFLALGLAGHAKRCGGVYI